MPRTVVQRIAAACVLASAMVLMGNTTASAVSTRTEVYHGSGYSDWGFAIHYARAQAYQRASADGFARADCVETETEIWMYEAHVTWECSREI
jgi:hypothetical protein